MQNIICHEGKCWEEDKKDELHVEELWEPYNIVDQIEKELWQKESYGAY